MSTSVNGGTPKNQILTTKVIATGRLTKAGSAPGSVMQEEVPATVNLYLDGIIENWYSKIDNTGVVFVLNVKSKEEARAILGKLPLGLAGLMEFDLLEVGPLNPLRQLLH